MLILGMFFLSACYSDGDEDPKERESSSLKYYARNLRFELESCTGTCLTMEVKPALLWINTLDQ